MAIVLGLGSADQLAPGMKFRVRGVRGIGTILRCSQRTCVGLVKASPDDVRASGTVRIE